MRSVTVPGPRKAHPASAEGEVKKRHETSAEKDRLEVSFNPKLDIARELERVFGEFLYLRPDRLVSCDGQSIVQMLTGRIRPAPPFRWERAIFCSLPRLIRFLIVMFACQRGVLVFCLADTGRDDRRRRLVRLFF